MAKSHKRIVRMEHIAQLEAKGVYTDAEIAVMMAMTPAGLAQLKQDPDYAHVKARYLGSLITSLDEELGDDIKALRFKLRAAVPRALDVLIKNLESPDPKVAQAASDRILNRDGRLAEVSRIGLPTSDQDGGVVTVVDDEVANALASAKKQAGMGNGQGSTTVQ